MKKLLLLVLLLCIVAAPELRGRARPHVRSVLANGVFQTAVVRPFIQPLLRRSTGEEMETIVRELEQLQSVQRLPHPSRFAQYLRDSHVSGRDGTDPWGMPYALVVQGDSTWVKSSGPDRRLETEDDLMKHLRHW